jgi:signal transduction histidine kinase
LIGNQFIMIIQDNGNGFDINHVNLGNGLQNMQKRAQELKGECFIHSKPEQGTKIELKLKL